MSATLLKNHSSRLVIEITEGIQDASLASRWEALTEIGVELALDDYGDKKLFSGSPEPL